MGILIRNGRVLLNEGLRTDVQLIIDQDGIEVIDEKSQPQIDQVIDAEQQLVLPGIIDLHGDAFERQILPRPKVHFPTDMALLETDRQMLGNGITTAYLGVTFSWESGLRGRESAMNVIEQVERLQNKLACDTRIHMRWETFNLQGEDLVSELIRNGRIHLLAFNDHMNDIKEDIETNDHNLMTLYARSGLSPEAFKNYFDETFARANEVPAAIARLAGLAYQHAIPCASHDDDSKLTRGWYDDLHVKISEFPIAENIAVFCRQLNNPIVLGAPNIVRGGSHCGRISASDAVARELCDVLTSDYFYPSMIHAVFMLMKQHALSIEKVWPLVSGNAARAALLNDRGEITSGKRADIIFVDDSNSELPEVSKCFIQGKLVYALTR